MMGILDAIVLGVVEGLTEFLPVSSTGHLILVSAWLGLQGEAIKSFEIVIQAGALFAVMILYRTRILTLLRGLGGDPTGRRLWVNLLISFAPAAVVGLLLHDEIKARLFHLWPVLAALTVGGLGMILFDRFHPPLDARRTVESITPRDAALIGLAQCLALWPGTSRSMVTLVAGMLLGLPAPVAAEYSFLLALPTLGAATVFDAAKSHELLLGDIGLGPMCWGFLTAMVVAALAIKGLVSYLTKHGLSLFGWYRMLLAALVWWAAPRW